MKSMTKVKKTVLAGSLLFLSFFAFSQTENRENHNQNVQTYRKVQVREMDGKVLGVDPVDPMQPYWAHKVSQDTWEWKEVKEPHFEGPIPFVHPPLANSEEPFYHHNHQPSITWCDNGDLLTVWFSTISEQGTEMTVLASRLRAGNDYWDPSSEFFKAENRNMSGSSIFNTGKGEIFHFNGMGAQGITKKVSKDLALVYRVSYNNGVSWSSPWMVSDQYKNTHQPVSGGFMTSKGVLVQVCDVTKLKKSDQSAIHISSDGGESWIDPGEYNEPLECEDESLCGNYIAGIHAGVVELEDGRLIALSRRHDIEGRMPMSISDDMGKTWRYEPSIFPPIGGGQRLVLMRLREGPILLISFTDKRSPEVRKGMTFTDQNGDEFTGYGIFAALSFDEGKTWPTRKLITPGKGTYGGGAWTGEFTATPYRAEHGGYLAATQSPDRMIHLISSRLYYQFNLAWLNEPNYIPTE